MVSLSLRGFLSPVFLLVSLQLAAANYEPGKVNSRCYQCSYHLRNKGDRCSGHLTLEKAKRHWIDATECKTSCYTRLDKWGNVVRGCYAGEYGVDPQQTGCHLQAGLLYCICKGNRCNNEEIPAYPGLTHNKEDKKTSDKHSTNVQRKNRKPVLLFSPAHSSSHILVAPKNSVNHRTKPSHNQDHQSLNHIKSNKHFIPKSHPVHNIQNNHARQPFIPEPKHILRKPEYTHGHRREKEDISRPQLLSVVHKLRDEDGYQPEEDLDTLEKQDPIQEEKPNRKEPIRKKEHTFKLSRDFPKPTRLYSHAKDNYSPKEEPRKFISVEINPNEGVVISERPQKDYHPEPETRPSVKIHKVDAVPAAPHASAQYAPPPPSHLYGPRHAYTHKAPNQHLKDDKKPTKHVYRTPFPEGFHAASPYQHPGRINRPVDNRRWHVDSHNTAVDNHHRPVDSHKQANHKYDSSTNKASSVHKQKIESDEQQKKGGYNTAEDRLAYARQNSKNNIRKQLQHREKGSESRHDESSVVNHKQTPHTYDNYAKYHLAHQGEQNYRERDRDHDVRTKEYQDAGAHDHAHDRKSGRHSSHDDRGQRKAVLKEAVHTAVHAGSSSPFGLTEQDRQAHLLDRKKSSSESRRKYGASGHDSHDRGSHQQSHDYRGKDHQRRLVDREREGFNRNHKNIDDVKATHIDPHRLSHQAASDRMQGYHDRSLERTKYNLEHAMEDMKRGARKYDHDKGQRVYGVKGHDDQSRKHAHDFKSHDSLHDGHKGSHQSHNTRQESHDKDSYDRLHQQAQRHDRSKARGSDSHDIYQGSKKGVLGSSEREHESKGDTRERQALNIQLNPWAFLHQQHRSVQSRAKHYTRHTNEKTVYDKDKNHALGHEHAARSGAHGAQGNKHQRRGENTQHRQAGSSIRKSDKPIQEMVYGLQP